MSKFFLVEKPFSSFLLCTATCVCFASTHADGQTEGGSIQEPVVVTATRTAQTVNETISSVTVITREDIERRQARSVEDLLRGETGLQMLNNGGRGKATSVLLRGTNSDHLLVLVDGIKVGSATLGTTSFQDLPVTQIERIEIVRGPRSSLYGSEALGGVIQIFTRRGDGGGLKPFLSLTAGSDQTYQGAAGVSGGTDQLFYNFSLSGTDTEGFDACQAEAATNFTACFADEPDNDGYQNLSGNLSLGSRFDNGSELTLSVLHSDNENEFDGNFQNESETVQQVIGLNAKLALTDVWWLKVVAGRSTDDSDNFINGAFASRFDTSRDSLTLQNDFILFDRDTLSIGGDYLLDEVDTDGDLNSDGLINAEDDFIESERENIGGFMQYLASLDGHDVELNARHDDNEQFGNEWTGSIGYGADVTDFLRLVASYGTAFKAPSFNELYFPDFGNPDLESEEAKSFEVGFKGSYPSNNGQGNGASWSLVWFNTLIDELIGFDSNFDAVNIDKAKIRGVEFTYNNRTHQHWLVGFGFTWQSPKNESGANRGNLLPRRAERQGRLDVDYLADQWSLGLTLTAAGRSFDDQENTRELGAWQTVDLRGEIKMSKHWLAQLKVENVFDQQYETASDYNQPDRGFFISLLYRP